MSFDTDTTPVLDHDGGLLTDHTLYSLQEFFERCDHRPSHAMWNAMADLAVHLERMATGEAEPKFFLSSLDPGIGKTMTITHFIDGLLSVPNHYGHVGVMVCVASLDEVEKLIDAIHVPADNVCVMTSDERLNALGVGRHNANVAQVLVTTQQMVEHHLDGGRFTEAKMFHFRGQPRHVRVWDESFLPGKALTLDRVDLISLLPPLTRSGHFKLANELEDLFTELRSVPDGTIRELPDLFADHALDLNDLLVLFETYRNNDDKAAKDKLRGIVTELWIVCGKRVTIRTDGPYGNTVLDYRDTLPDDLAPMVITDASGRVRTTYVDMAKGRENLTFLKTAPKDYGPLTVHVWNASGSKSGFARRDRTKRGRLVTGIAETIMSKPTEDWLVVVHRKDHKVGSVAHDVRAALHGVTGTVSFITWGNHRATNKFASVSNVILAGTLFYRTSYLEALTRLAKGRPASKGPVAVSEREQTQQGEHRHLVLQALCRGAVRRCDGNKCHPMDAYVIASVRSGIRKTLKTIFPGCRVVDWKPVPDELKGEAARAFKFTRAWFDFSEPGERLTFKRVVKATGIKPDTFKKRVRGDKDYIEALAAEGIVEHGEGTYLTGYRRLDG